MIAEKQRLIDANTGLNGWKGFGPYLSERQWGTVREDYSTQGDAWNYFPHDHARSRAYRWGEDGIAGFSDEQSRLCLALSLWNGKDQILKERLFGLSNAEGNHGEDVKELYYYLDATPTHSYLKMLYKYPHQEYPYAQLVEENARRKADNSQVEYELLDTGVFDDDRYYDVFVEYAKASPDDILMRVTIINRGPADEMLYVIPQIWFRNTWKWKPGERMPEIRHSNKGQTTATHSELGTFNLYSGDKAEYLFCNNETNPRRHFGQQDCKGFFKDALHEYVVNGNHSAVNSEGVGTKVGVLHKLVVPANGASTVQLRLAKTSHIMPFSDFDTIFSQRKAEADEFYSELQHGINDADARHVQRQAFAGMIWSKQYYYFDVPEWVKGDADQPSPPPERLRGRNHQWQHLNNADIISMPDKWEYPWYAAWDLAFHCIPLAMVDAEFAKDQLVLLTREWYMHPNGQLPAYEWAFGDVNPPVHAWATWRVFQIDRKQRRADNSTDSGDLIFLERVFHKLMLNFTWWVNRKDAEGRNIFRLVSKICG